MTGFSSARRGSGVAVPAVGGLGDLAPQLPADPCFRRNCERDRDAFRRVAVLADDHLFALRRGFRCFVDVRPYHGVGLSTAWLGVKGFEYGH